MSGSGGDDDLFFADIGLEDGAEATPLMDFAFEEREASPPPPERVLGHQKIVESVAPKMGLRGMDTAKFGQGRSVPVVDFGTGSEGSGQKAKKFREDGGFGREMGDDLESDVFVFDTSSSAGMAHDELVAQMARAGRADGEDDGVPLGIVAEYDVESVEIVCQFCDARVHTRVVFANGGYTYLSAMVLSIFGLCCVPFFLKGSKDVLHYCPRCGRNVGRFKRLAF